MALNDVVRHVLRTREHEQTAHDVDVREDLAAALPPVSGNRGALEQVVLNLVVNAEHALAGVPAERRRLVVRTRLGHQVTEASDGISALARLREGTFDLILSDLRMPGLSGESLLSRLREEDSPMQDRIVFVTGAVDGPGVVDFLASSAVRVLLKPFEFDELATLLDEVTPLG